MQLVRSGYSWSGNERNCVFLNCTPTGGTDDVVARFTNASAITGLDFPDDARSVAVVDWDNDGDLDLWFRNRTAPRLRCMQNLTNEIAPDTNHISLRLIGTTCNRDAIGARVELVLNATEADRQDVGDESDGGSESGFKTEAQRLVRSVRAGDAFLSQSSKQLHFAIPEGTSVRELIVDWPGGEREKFLGVPPGASYEIRQGAGQPVRLKPRDPVSLVAASYVAMPQTAAARVVLPGRVALPPIALTLDSASEPQSAGQLDRPAPRLITFWTSSCANCRQELADIAKHQSKFEQANLSVTAVCLDGLGEAPDANGVSAGAADEFLQRVGFPFQAVRTTRETVEGIRHFQNILFSKFPGFVVPLSFLVDADGQVVSIYRGTFSHETYLQDRALVDLDDVMLRTLATPLAGTWITKPATASQFAEFVGSRLIARQPTTALGYFEAAIKAETDDQRKQVLRDKVEQLKRTIGNPRRSS